MGHGYLQHLEKGKGKRSLKRNLRSGDERGRKQAKSEVMEIKRVECFRGEVGAPLLNAEPLPSSLSSSNALLNN